MLAMLVAPTIKFPSAFKQFTMGKMPTAVPVQLEGTHDGDELICDWMGWLLGLRLYATVCAGILLFDGDFEKLEAG